MWNEDPHNTPVETGIHLASSLPSSAKVGDAHRTWPWNSSSGWTDTQQNRAGVRPRTCTQMFRAAVFTTAPKGKQLKCPSAVEGINRHPRTDGKDRQGGTNHSHPTAGTAPRWGRCLQKSLPLAPLEKSLLARKLPYGVGCQGGIQPGEGAPGRPGVPAAHCFLTEVVAPGFSTVTTHCPQMCVVWSAGGLSVLCWSKSSLGFFRNMQETRTNFWANPMAYTCVFPGGASGEEPACQGRRCRDASSVCGPGGFPGGGTGNPLQCSGWRIPRTEEPGGLQPMGPQRVGHD